MFKLDRVVKCLYLWLILVTNVIAEPQISQSTQQELQQLIDLSLEELLNIEITSVNKIPETREHAAATVYVLTADHIRKLGWRNLTEVLSIVPGVDTSDNHFFLQGGQRGFMGPFSQSLLLINGREMNNLIAGETFIANQFRTHNVKQIEVIAGPASAQYGANAVGGVINIITKTPAEMNGASVAISYGAFNTQVVDASFGKEFANWKISGALAYYRSDEEDFSNFLSNPQEASPAAENNAYRHLPNQYGYHSDSAALPASFYIEKRGLYLGSEYYQNRSGRGTASMQWDYNDSGDFRQLWMKYAGYRTTGLLDGKLDLWLEYRHYWERFWGNHTESTGPLEDPVTQATITEGATLAEVAKFRGFYSNKDSRGSRKQTALMESVYRLSAEQTLVTGLNYEYSDVVSAAWSRTAGEHPPLSEDNYRPEFRNNKWEGYVQYDHHLWDNTLFLTLGSRLVSHQRYGNEWLPRFGLVYQPSKETTFKLLYGKSFREPSVFELASNSAIRPMKADTYELGWHRYLGSHFKNEAVLFFNKAPDLIVSDNVTAIANRGQLRSRGLEDILHFQYADWNGFLNYTYMDLADTEDNGITTAIYDIPTHKANLAVMYALSPPTSLGLVGRYRSRVDTSYQNQVYPIDSYLVWDLTWRMNKVPWLGKGVGLSVITKNVFDQTYYHPEPRDNNALKHPQEGRSIWLQLELTF